VRGVLSEGFQTKALPTAIATGIIHIGRKIEGSNARHHSKRLAPELAGHASRDFHLAAGIQVLQAQREFEHLDALEQSGTPFGERLAAFERDTLRDLRLTGQKLLTKSEKHRAAFFEWHSCPFMRCHASRSDCLFHFGGAPERYLPDGLAEIRTAHFMSFWGGDPATIDPVVGPKLGFGLTHAIHGFHRPKVENPRTPVNGKGAPLLFGVRRSPKSSGAPLLRSVMGVYLLDRCQCRHIHGDKRSEQLLSTIH